ncbi:hypothetical protein [Nonomuraea basaltis]|uniref:hypothetical protein n=1 Tax=Nonomuraea basaltis TaxID=2495887 RepID=UPI00110C5B5F|nr:hypothetical protein [Nonomuraea basaltis]TMR91366.1 hypothetical protein EJK15_50290 [Nonomuraea basaltis]
MSEYLPDLQFVTPAGKGPGPIGRVVLVLLWLGLCLMPAVFAVRDFELATGRIGTPGTLRVVSCEALGEGRYDCKGSFTPDSGGAAVPVDASPDSEAGDVLRAQLTPEGDRAAPAGTKGVLAAMTLPAVGFGGLGFLPYVIMYWLGARRGRRAAVAGGFLVTAAGGVLMVVGLVAAYS